MYVLQYSSECGKYITWVRSSPITPFITPSYVLVIGSPVNCPWLHLPTPAFRSRWLSALVSIVTDPFPVDFRSQLCSTFFTSSRKSLHVFVWTSHTSWDMYVDCLPVGLSRSGITSLFFVPTLHYYIVIGSSVSLLTVALERPLPSLTFTCPVPRVVLLECPKPTISQKLYRQPAFKWRV